MNAVEDRNEVAWRGLAVVAGLFIAVLVALSGRYGYHRDELYFLVIGGEPAWGYVDQPPLVPLLAHAMDSLFDGSLVMLRVPPALASAGVVVVTGLIARELGGRKPTQILAASCMAVSSIAMAAGHLAGTTAFDLFGWTLLSWLLVRAIRDGGPGWLLVGLVAGVALEVKTLVVFLLFAVTVGLLAVGPRSVFKSRWPYLAALIAAALWAPNLLWQAANDWPQLELSKAIADGSSGTSDSPVAFVLLQLGLISPLLVPVWVIGWWRLLRDPALAPWRCFAVAYPLLAVVFLVIGGKAYYLAGLYPMLLASGAHLMHEWAVRRRDRLVVPGVLVLSLAASAYLFLPIAPPSHIDGSPIGAVNYDAGEQVGWPEFAAVVQAAYDDLDPAEQQRAVFLGGNYGETGAVSRYAPDIAAYGVQNSLWDLGPPPAGADTVIAVGWTAAEMGDWCSAVTQVATMDNDAGVDNDEADRPVLVCRGLRSSWTDLWPDLRRLG